MNKLMKYFVICSILNLPVIHAAKANWGDPGEYENFIGNVKVINTQSGEQFSLVGPHGEMIIEPEVTSHFRGDFVSCIHDGAKQKRPVYITARVETTDKGTYLITDFQNAGCDLSNAQLPAVSYSKHCTRMSLGQKTVRGKYLGLDVGDFVHFNFEPDAGDAFDNIYADQDAVERDLGNQTDIPIELTYEDRIDWMSDNVEDIDGTFIGRCEKDVFYVSAKKIGPANGRNSSINSQSPQVDQSDFCSKMQAFRQQENVYDPRTGRQATYYGVSLLSRFDHPFKITDFIINRNQKLKLNPKRGAISVNFGQSVLLMSRINARSQPIEITFSTDLGTTCTLSWN